MNAGPPESMKHNRQDMRESLLALAMGTGRR